MDCRDFCRRRGAKGHRSGFRVSKACGAGVTGWGLRIEALVCPRLRGLSRADSDEVEEKGAPEVRVCASLSSDAALPSADAPTQFTSCCSASDRVLGTHSEGCAPNVMGLEQVVVGGQDAAGTDVVRSLLHAAPCLVLRHGCAKWRWC